MRKVFLGGTDGSTWRDQIRLMLKLDAIQPSLLETDLEIAKKKNAADFELYVFTPLQRGFYEVAQAVAAAYRRKSGAVIICIVDFDNSGGADIGWDDVRYSSMIRIADMLASSGAKYFGSLEEASDYLNTFYVEIPFDPSMVQCLIKREGPTQVRLGTEVYNFTQNELGDYTCPVQREDHRQHLFKTGNFRLYQEDKKPPELFSYDERNFIREWETKAEMAFVTYVNSHIAMFDNCKPAVRKLAIDKWNRFMAPKEPRERMACPIRPVETREPMPATIDETASATDTAPIETEGNDDTVTPIDVIPSVQPDYVTWTPEQWETWVQTWLRLSADRYRAWIANQINEQMLLEAPDKVYERAESKWKSLCGNEPFPLIEDDEDEDQGEES